MLQETKRAEQVKPQDIPLHEAWLSNHVSNPLSCQHKTTSSAHIWDMATSRASFGTCVTGDSKATAGADCIVERLFTTGVISHDLGDAIMHTLSLPGPRGRRYTLLLGEAPDCACAVSRPDISIPLSLSVVHEPGGEARIVSSRGGARVFGG